MIDLPDELGRLRDEAGAQASSAPPLNAILAGRRRRRVVRRSAAAVTTAVAATAVVLVGAGLAGGPERPAPPAEHTATAGPTASPSPTAGPTTEPTPQPTTPAVVLPVGDPSLPFGVCGSVVGAPTEHPLTTVIGAYAVPQGATVVQGDVLVTDSSVYVADLDADPAFNSGAVPALGPTLVIVKDGVVVAVDAPADRPVKEWYTYGEWTPHPGTLVVRGTELTVCTPGQDAAGEGSAGVPLPPGEYAVLPLAEVIPLGASQGWPEGYPNHTDEQLAELPEPRATAVGPSVPFTITAGTAAPGTEPLPLDGYAASLSEYRYCGEPAPEVRRADGVLGLDGPPPATTLVAGDVLRADSGLSYRGPGRWLAAVFAPEVWIVRDGVVVGLSQVFSDPGYGSVDIESRLTLRIESGATPRACVDGEDSIEEPVPLAPGDYELYVGVVVESASVRTDGAEEQQMTERRSVLYRGPFPLTVD